MNNEDQVTIARALETGDARRLLHEFIGRMESGISRSMTHTLSFSQLDSLNSQIKIAKREWSIGAYLKHLTEKKRRYKHRLFTDAIISESYWSEVLNNKKSPSKDLLFRVAIALRLSPEETFELLKTGGVSLSENEVKDVIIHWFINEEIYEFSDIDEILVLNDTSPLIKERAV